MPKRIIQPYQVNEIRSIRDEIGQEHLIDALMEVGKKKKIKDGISLGLIKSLTFKQAARVLKQLRRIQSGEIKWLRWRDIPGRYPPRFNRIDKQEGSVVYFISDGQGHVKIGRSTNVQKRLKALQSANPNHLRLLTAIKGGSKTESKYHYMFSRLRVSGEWFKLDNTIKEEIERLRHNN